jgi:rubredoxin
MSDRLYCPTCGVQRTGPTCTNCGYDFVEATTMPVVRQSRGINPASLALGIIGLLIVAVIVLAVLGADLPRPFVGSL